MKWTKEKYLDIINNSPIFDIEDNTSDEYFTEYRYLQNKVCEYYYEYQPWAKKYSLELLDKFKECVNAYSKEKGEFIVYLGVAFKRTVNKKVSIEKVNDMRSGMVKQSTQNSIRYLINIAKNKGWDIDDKDIVEKLCGVTGKSKNKIEELLSINRQAVALSECVTVDGEELSLFDSVADTVVNTEQIVIGKESLENTLNKIDKAIIGLSQSKMQVISAVLTLLIIDFDFEQVIEISKIRMYSFFSNEVYILQMNQNKKITESDIAKLLGKTKPYISKVKSQVFKLIGESL